MEKNITKSEEVTSDMESVKKQVEEVESQESGQESQEDKTIKRKKKFKPVFYVLILIIILILSSFVYKLFNGYYPWAGKAERQDVKQAEIINKVSKHILLPSGSPVVAAIDDASKLRNQQKFFNLAENGDYLLLFPESGTAIIYSPDKNILVNVGSINYGADNQNNITENTDSDL